MINMLCDFTMVSEFLIIRFFSRVYECMDASYFLELQSAQNLRTPLQTEGHSHRSVFQDAKAWGVGVAECGWFWNCLEAVCIV